MADVNVGSGVAVLQARGICKVFGQHRALDMVDFEARAGEVHALLGENGAGKSTLIKILTGAYQPDEGEVLVDGVPVDFRDPLQAQAAGIGTVYQEVNLLPNRSVAENLFRARSLAAIRWRCSRWSRLPGRWSFRARCWCLMSPPPALTVTR